MASISDRSDVVQHFWGMTLGAKGGQKSFQLSLTQTELQITQATFLGEGTATLCAATAVVGSLPLCVLGDSASGLPRSALLDLNFFPEDDSVTLSVKGTGAITIAGTLATFGTIPDDEEEEEEEEEGEKEAAGAGSAAGKGAAARAAGKQPTFVPAPAGHEGAGEDEDFDEELELDHILGDDDEEEEDEDDDGIDDDELEEEEEEEEEEEAAPAAAAKQPPKAAAAAAEASKRKREDAAGKDGQQPSKKQAVAGALAKPAAAGAAQGAAAAAAPPKPSPSASPAGPSGAPALGEWYSVPQTQNKVRARDLVVGKGAEAGKGCKVTVAYKGTLKSGKQFDASRNFSFNLLRSEVIKGWDVGVFGMREGGTRELVIHPDYACACPPWPP